MPIMILALLVVVVLAVVIIAVVVMGMEGTGKDKHPEIAHAMARTARHLNGEGEPPKALLTLFDEIDEVPQVRVRELPNKLRLMRSARSAASADPPEEASQPKPVVNLESAADQPDQGKQAGESKTDTPGPMQRNGTARPPRVTIQTPRPVSAEAGTTSEKAGAETWTSKLAAKASSAAKTGTSKLVAAGKTLKQTVEQPAPDATSPSPPDDDKVVRQVRAGKRKRKRNKSGRPPLAPLPRPEGLDEGQRPERPSSEELNHSIAEALAGPVVADPAEEDPYGVWGADELDPEPRGQQPVRLGRSRRT